MLLSTIYIKSDFQTSTDFWFVLDFVSYLIQFWFWLLTEQKYYVARSEVKWWSFWSKYLMSKMDFICRLWCHNKFLCLLHSSRSFGNILDFWSSLDVNQQIFSRKSVLRKVRKHFFWINKICNICKTCNLIRQARLSTHVNKKYMSTQNFVC